jgi:hypothetical protein
MAKKFIHGVGPAFSKHPITGSFVAMTSPCPYGQWDFTSTAFYGASFANSSGWVRATADGTLGYGLGNGYLRMLHVDGFNTLRGTVSSNVSDANAHIRVGFGDAVQQWDSQVLYMPDGSYDFTVPYYRYRLTLSLFVTGPSGSWVQVDFSLI